MGKIATRAFCNTLKSGAFSSELTRCPTRSEITPIRFGSNGLIVMEEDIKNLISIIVVGEAGNIIRTQV